MTDEQPPARRLHATVYGRVQGVNFRATTRRTAQALDLKGWVANQPGGAVETVAEGTEQALQQFLDFLHRGPPSASVSRVDAAWEEAAGEFTGFNIRYL